MIVAAFDCAFVNLGYAILEIINDNIRIITTGVVVSKDKRSQTKPSMKLKPNKKTGEEELVKSRKKRKGSTSDEDTRRIDEFIDEMILLLEGHKVECVFAELPVGSRNATSSKNLAFAKAICITVTKMMDLPHVWVSPNDVKNTAKMLLGITEKKGPDPDKKEIIDLVVSMYKGVYDGWPYEKFKNGTRRIKVTVAEHICDAVIVAHAAKGTKEFINL